MVGRDAELRQLHCWLEKAASGTRQVVFVTGESGIGKTTVVDIFLQSLGRVIRDKGGKREDLLSLCFFLPLPLSLYPLSLLFLPFALSSASTFSKTARHCHCKSSLYHS